MALTTETVRALAPDQPSLNAASKLAKTAKWPLLAFDDASNMVWGECQGSGANPYRTVFDLSDHGCKCTCPSRKFPCKHALALMWIYAEDSGSFRPGTVPEWVVEWQGRRRKTAKPALKNNGGDNADKRPQPPKSIALAKASADGAGDNKSAKADDPKAMARREAAAAKRKEETQQSLLAAVDALEAWIEDQLRMGLSGLLKELQPRCRAIAARLVDDKAATLAGRIDELPAQIMALSREHQLDALVMHLGQLVVLARSFRAEPQRADLKSAIGTAETREMILNDPQSLRVTSEWEFVGERITTRRDGLISQASWLLNLQEQGPRFGLLLDFFPAGTGNRQSAFLTGTQFTAELVFYPGNSPLRALIATRSEDIHGQAWPALPPEHEPLAELANVQAESPWRMVHPVLLPKGEIASDVNKQAYWVQGAGTCLPLKAKPHPALVGTTLRQSAALWDGTHLSILSTDTQWGRVALDG